jgi:5-(carboxyamino)imidazole ribonucleotide synthase
MPEFAPLRPGAAIGILGGGQLGRMLALAAARLGFKCHIYAPPGDNPAFDVAHAHTAAAYNDTIALEAFARAVDVATYEFENVPVETARIIAKHTALAPSAAVLEITQDRLDEKTFLRDLGIELPAFAAVSSLDDLMAAVADIGRPSVLKTRRMGYDGKGQVKIDADTDLAQAWQAIAGAPAILEAFVPFSREVSVIAARARDGAVQVYDIPENQHENHILARSIVPCGLPDRVAQQAVRLAENVANAFEYIGVFAVELFVVGDGADCRLLANEIAPRVHNSGHWTEAACAVSQFEQHIRAIAGWPLGSPARHSDAVMHNLLGSAVDDAVRLAGEAGTMVHVYGKAEAREGRKMGHVTYLAPRSSA